MFKPEVMKTWAKQVEEKKPAVEEDMDLFGDDDDAEVEKEREARIEKIAKEQAAKKALKKVVAKSVLIVDVKVYEMEQDLAALAQEVYKIEMDGLVWNKEPKFIEVAYGMKKL